LGGAEVDSLSDDEFYFLAAGAHFLREQEIKIVQAGIALAFPERK
jgi:hypothetical protein